MAKLADAADLKSADQKWLWGFKSPSRYHNHLILNNLHTTQIPLILAFVNIQVSSVHRSVLSISEPPYQHETRRLQLCWSRQLREGRIGMVGVQPVSELIDAKWAWDISGAVNDAPLLIGPRRRRPGFYLYVGSALGPGGISAAHHIRPADWHIDYLRLRTTIEEIWFSYDRKSREHDWARFFAGMKGCRWPGFGSSDCDCESFLFFFKKCPARAEVNSRTDVVLGQTSAPNQFRAELEWYPVKAWLHHLA